MGRMDRAASSFEHSLTILESSRASKPLDTATVLMDYANLLRKMKHKSEARRMEDRARAMLGGKPVPAEVSVPVQAVR
jgi:hypothetical protein